MALYQQSQMAQFTAANGGYTGYTNQAPFNPYASIPMTQPVTSPFVTIGPAPTVPVLPAVGSQVVYAHYGAPGQAVAGATTAGGAVPGTPVTPATPVAATPKPADTKKPTETKKPDPKPEPKPEPKTVTVKSGDSLSKIAAANGTTWQKLYELNKGLIGGNPNLIRPGQELKMP
jgi:nucleoid-associated protein YgaU